MIEGLWQAGKPRDQVLSAIWKIDRHNPQRTVASPEQVVCVISHDRCGHLERKQTALDGLVESQRLQGMPINHSLFHLLLLFHSAYLLSSLLPLSWRLNTTRSKEN